MSGLTLSLPDGSNATVESTGPRSSLISRSVDDVCVWGQAFACGGDEADHEAQVHQVVEAMRLDPSAFRRWWLE